MNKLPLVAIVAPCYNEEEVLNDTTTKLLALMDEMVSSQLIHPDSFIAYVDDGSRDKTWQLIEASHQISKYIKGLKLAGNVGHQKALLSGLLTFKDKADCVISIDADLQDDIRVIKDMIIKFNEGVECVYGIRKERTTDSYFKRKTAELFYTLMLKMKVKVQYNHADFRLASRRVLNGLEEFGEVNLFLRGIFPVIGYKSDVVYYDRLERLLGESKYPLRKMLSFAWDGITSFSVTPLRLVSSIGFIIFGCSLLVMVYAIVSYFLGNTVQGWVSTVLPMYFLGGIQLLCFGVIGEYIGKIYTEVKRRPRYIVDKILFDNEEKI
jgi:glycosyltransferase involved in cell wall biosynthesis